MGFVNSGIRRSVWSALLGISNGGESRGQEEEEAEILSLQEVEKSYPIISRDVARSGNSWRGKGSVRLSTRRRKQQALAVVLVNVIKKYGGHLHYYQGLHDIALTLLEVETSTIVVFTRYKTPIRYQTLQRYVGEPLSVLLIRFVLLSFPTCSSSWSRPVLCPLGGP